MLRKLITLIALVALILPASASAHRHHHRHAHRRHHHHARVHRVAAPHVASSTPAPQAFDSTGAAGQGVDEEPLAPGEVEVQGEDVPLTPAQETEWAELERELAEGGELVFDE